MIAEDDDTYSPGEMHLVEVQICPEHMPTVEEGETTYEYLVNPEDGEWKASLSFDGYELPAKDLIPREQLFAEPNVPGFQKCSIAFLPDVGKEGVTFPMRWARDASGKVREDRAFNLREAIRGGLG